MCSQLAVTSAQLYFGAGLVHIYNSTTLRFDYYRTTEQKKHDEVYLVKRRA